MKHFVKTHFEKIAPIAIVAIIAAIFITPFFVYSHLQTKARNQAIARAKQMDGRVYTIDNVAWNWIGDTKLILKNDRGENAGWVMIYMANPLDAKINPLTLTFTHPHDPIPVPMKVRAHFRQNPWADKYDGKVKDNFTGSYVEFEILEGSAS